jgi:LDH2 family malate/lactate/ureidoglycolate dehydrogenase
MPLLRFSTVELRRLGVEIFERLGTPREYAELVVDTLIDASLAGHDSHGILYITRYAERIRKGIIDPKSEPEVTSDSPSTAIIDGHWAFGQLTAKKTMEIAIQKAKKTSISAVGAFHCNHIGRLGAYTLLAAENNMIGILMVNSINPSVQPYGGTSGVLGTNPISVAIPAGEMKPFLLDFATSSVAAGKIWQAAMKGEKIPLGWIVNNDGCETDNPHDFSISTPTVEGNGRLLTFGARDGHKGYCLAILMEILGGLLTGAGSILDRETVHPNENGILAIVLDIERFTSVETFKKRMDSLFSTIHKAPVDSQFTYDQVQVPGEIEWRNREKGLRDGIEIPLHIWKQIVGLAGELGVDTSVKNPH